MSQLVLSVLCAVGVVHGYIVTLTVSRLAWRDAVLSLRIASTFMEVWLRAPG